MPFKDADKRREYQREYHKKWYQSNADKRRAQVRLRRKQVREKLQMVKAQGECVMCGLSGSIATWALDYHHINHHEKVASVSYLVGNGYSWKKIEKEIAKCELICSNCRRIKHYEEHQAGIKHNKKIEGRANATRRERKKRRRNERKKYMDSKLRELQEEE